MTRPRAITAWKPAALLMVLAAALSAAEASAPKGFPNTDERLDYSINWPTGLSLGEAHLSARKLPANRWEFEFRLDAAIPGYTVSDHYRALASGDFCTAEFEKEYTHGSRKAREKTVFDYKKSVARRNTVNGGKSEIPISECARDALDFVFFTRRELEQGRMPRPHPVLFGAQYEVKLEYGGQQTVSVNEKPMPADRVAVSVKGPKADWNFEIFFSRDAARKPLVIRVPFALGTFSMELVR